MPGILAQAVVDQWWETVPAQIVLWASALAAVLYIIKKLFGGAEFARRVGIVLLSLGEVEKWPNGSHTLPGSLNVIYDKLTRLEGKFDEHVDEFHVHVQSHEGEAWNR